MFKQILVPLDGSIHAEQALPIASRIAHASDGTVILLHVNSGNAGGRAGWHVWHEDVKADAMDATGYLANVAHIYGLDREGMKVVIFIGPDALTILDTVTEHLPDLIVIAGCQAPKLPRSSPVPVLILPYEGKVSCDPYPDKMRPLHAITAVVALDGSPLAEAALEPAAQLVAALASPAQGSLHLVQVVQLAKDKDGWHGGERMDPLIGEQAIDVAARYLKKKAGDVRERLEADFNLAVTWSVVVASNVADALKRVAEEGKVTLGSRIFGGSDLLVLATHGRSGLRRWIWGSVTERVLGNTKLPVLVVHPEQEQSGSIMEAEERERGLKGGAL